VLPSDLFDGSAKAGAGLREFRNASRGWLRERVTNSARSRNAVGALRVWFRHGRPAHDDGVTCEPSDTATRPPDAGPPDPRQGTLATLNTQAVVALVLALLWLLGAGSVGAVLLGRAARREIARSDGRPGGGGIATAAVVLGWVGIVGTLLFVGALVLQLLAFAGLSEAFEEGARSTP